MRFNQTMLLGLILLLWVGPLHAATRVIEEIDIQPGAEGTEVQVRFNLPLRYLAHTPADKGDLLQVEMRPLFAEPEMSELGGRKVYSWQPTPLQPLHRLTYEGDAPGGPQLVFEFDRQVEYRIKSSSDPLRLSLILLPQLEATPKVTPRPAPVPVAPTTQVVKTAPPTPVSPVDISGPYVVNLESSLAPIQASLPEGRPDLAGYRLYQSRFTKDGKLWHRLRLGFFADKKSALKVLNSLKKTYPQAWLARASLLERENSAATALYEPEPVAAAQPPSAAPAAPPAYTQAVSKTQQLLDEAEASMVAGEYQRAAILYSRLKQARDPQVRQLAQEYLGLARDRANQLAHAKAEYENYLKLYPEGEGAERVRQRLNVLLTARSTPKAPLRKARGEAAEGWRHEAYGSFSQFYYRDSLTTDAGGTLLAQSTLRSDLDLNTRSRSENLDVRTTFIGGLENDFRDEGDDEFRVSAFYADLTARRPDLSLRLGRQSRSSGGVLGRFDGGLLRWQFHEKVAVNLVGGFPVLSASDTDINTDRPFYGVSVDLGTFARRWDFNLFVIEQQVESLTDRQAIGGEVRYFEPTRSFFALVDYDTLYEELNTALFNGSLRLPDNTTLTLSADYRNSPILTTSNALQGQTQTGIDQLLLVYTEDQIEQLARDRTATSQNYTFGVTHPFNAKLQLSADITLSRFGSTPASGGVDALPGTGNEYFYALQLIGSSLLKDGDIAIIGLRYSDTSTADTWALNLNTRYPLTSSLRLNPKFLVDYRNTKGSDDNRWRMRPSLRLEYRWKRRLYLEFEGGGEWADEEIAGQNSSSRDIFFTLGYRLDF